MANETGYKATVDFATKELSVKEKIQLKDVLDCEKLDEATANSAVIIDVDYFASVHVHNPMAKENKEYDRLVIVSKDGTKYSTSSQSVRTALMDIWDDLVDAGETADFAVKIFQKPSKNYSGKFFMTCSLV